MTAREKLSGVLVLGGLVLLCAEQLPAAVAGAALLGAGAVALNWQEIRAKLRKIGSQRPEARSPSRANRNLTRGCAAAAKWLSGHRAKKKAARTSRKRQNKKYTQCHLNKEKRICQ